MQCCFSSLCIFLGLMEKAVQQHWMPSKQYKHEICEITSPVCLQLDFSFSLSFEQINTKVIKATFAKTYFPVCLFFLLISSPAVRSEMKSKRREHWHWQNISFIGWKKHPQTQVLPASLRSDQPVTTSVEILVTSVVPLSFQLLIQSSLLNMNTLIINKVNDIHNSLRMNMSNFLQTNEITLCSVQSASQKSNILNVQIKFSDVRRCISQFL